ncbi:MAG: NTP transferase domain-containing protein [Myxococcota bacterium]
MNAELAILAGGLATRLGERARNIPKSLVPVHGRPFIAWQLERIKACGFDHVVLCVGHLGAALRDFVGSGSSFGVKVSYSDDGDSPLGTGGALLKALPLLSDSFVVTYGDSYLPFDYRAPLTDLRLHPDAEGCLAVYRNQDRWDRSNTCVRGEHVVAYRKGANDPAFDYIDYGALALRAESVRGHTKECPFGLETLQTELAAAGTLRAFVSCERFYEVGSEQGIREFSAYIARGN